jgi:hypothetical protein
MGARSVGIGARSSDASTVTDPYGDPAEAAASPVARLTVGRVGDRNLRVGDRNLSGVRDQNSSGDRRSGANPDNPAGTTGAAPPTTGQSRPSARAAAPMNGG